MRVLVLEDNRRFGDLVVEHLTDAGYAVDLVDTAQDCRVLDKTFSYDLYVVDLGLPDGDGIELIRELRSLKRDSPVLVMTARSGAGAVVEGLDAGADDYLIKPFNHQELLARVRALLRRSPISQPDVYEAGHVVFDAVTGDATCGNHRLTMRPSERQLFALLIRHAGRTVPRAMIENSMKSVNAEWSPNAIDKLVSRLRKALNGKDTGIQLKTVKGVGYILEVLM